MSRFTGEEIQQKIDENNKLIESMLKPGQFVLNKRINQLLEENDNYRMECPHEYESGYCKFCGFKEGRVCK